MKIIFRGVRGSIAFPGPQSVKYGGNTTCIEVRGAAGELIILDAGTGIFPLAQTLLKEMPIDCHIFITHTHWDHIQGLPFFIPLFVPGNRVTIYGPFDPINQLDIREVLSRQMEYTYFPVRECELRATIEYRTLHELESVRIGQIEVGNVFMNHPVLNFGYRLRENDQSLFFTGDHEWQPNIYEPDDEGFREFEAFIAQRRSGLIDFFRGVDVLIADSSYTREEYQGQPDRPGSSKRGWGHGTYDTSLAMAREAGVKALYCTHHEPTRSDAQLEAQFKEAMQRLLGEGGDGNPVCHLAQEGSVIEVSRAGSR